MGQWDLAREGKRQAVIDAGLERISNRCIGLLRTALNASSLCEDAGIARDTAYRLFRNPDGSSSDRIVTEVAIAATDPAWSGFAESSEEIARAFQAAVEHDLPTADAIIESMAANVDAQFRSPGGPVGWLFHAVAIPVSPAWKGPSPVLSAEDRRLAEELLAIRASFYRAMSDELLQFMIATMSMIGRRPRRGMDPRQLLALMHSLIDGAVLRRYLEPEVFDSRLVGEAVYALALAFSEDGALSDPRRPDMPDAAAVFDALIAEAASSWDTPESRTVAATAATVGAAYETATLLFPSDADLADSVVWSQVLGGGSLIERYPSDRPADTAAATELAMVFGLLRRVRDLTSTLPGAVAVVLGAQPVVGSGVRAQLEREVAEVVRCHCPGVDPGVTAHELVAAAFSSEGGWSTVTAMMRLLSPRSA